MPQNRTAPLVQGQNLSLAANTFFDDDVTATDVLVQTGPTLLHGAEIHNATGAVAFAVFFNAAAIADVTIGTTVPNLVIGLIANGNASRDFSTPVSFPLGLVIASLTTTNGSSGAAQDFSLQYS